VRHDTAISSPRCDFAGLAVLGLGLIGLVGVSACDENVVEVPSDGVSVVDTRADTTPLCHEAGAPCTSDTDCCSDVCRRGQCLGVACCVPAGEVCETPDECCSGSCDATTGTCRNCRAVGAGCNLDSDCCTGRCDVHDGLCVQCLPEYRRCESDADCCSGRCDPEHELCLGCTPAGQACETDADCCGELGCTSDTKICVGCIDNSVDRCGALPCCNQRMECADGRCSCPEPEGAPCENHVDCCSGTWNEVALCDEQDRMCDSFLFEPCGPHGPCYRPARTEDLCGPHCPDFYYIELVVCDIATHECPERGIYRPGNRCTSNSECAGSCGTRTEVCQSCRSVGDACNSDSLPCCSGICDPKTSICVGCLETGRSCEQDSHCCSGLCAHGECAGPCSSTP